MSGLQAIGVAAAILQFVDFGSKLLVTGYDVYKSQRGATPQAIHTQRLCTELRSISAQLGQAQTGNINLNDREQSLWRLADRAHDLAWHLGLLLDSLKLKKATFRSWGALRQSWRVLHQKDKIAELAAQLEEIRSLIDTNLLVLLRDDTSLLIRLVNDQTQQSKHIHDDNINAVQSLKNDLLTTMQQHRDSALQSHDISLRKICDQVASLAQLCTAHKNSEQILESLYCEEVHRRELGVSDAVDRTFDWAFDSWCPGNFLDCGCKCTGSIDKSPRLRCSRHLEIQQRPCAGSASHQRHLLRWLENKTSEPFIITGKPGSGKSTFMKFIASHEQTLLALTSWAGGNRLLVARFYFWSSGSPIQRSQEGLLRCLLYQILSQAPELIPIAVPRRWQAAADRPRSNEPWTRREISDAFSSVVSSDLSGVDFCFFVDGLDEYGGSDLGSGESDLDLVLQLKKLSSSPHIKLCVSSRPRNVFQRHLINDESYHIVLHNHTTNDIELFVQSRIEGVQQLIGINASELEELQHVIVERSSGVFLWVVLVVRELFDGLEPPFSMPEMQERILLLPESLDDYFQRILDKVHQQYRRFTARLLLMSIDVLVRNSDLDLEIAYCLWLLDQGIVHSRHTTLAQQQPPHISSRSWQSDSHLRIRKSCGDFLETFPERKLQYVSHVHRSAADFLSLPKVKSQLLRQADWQDSDIPLAFCEAFVSSIEPGVLTFNIHVFSIIEKLARFMKQAAQYELRSRRSCADLLYRLDSVLCSLPLQGMRHNDLSHWTHWMIEPCCSNFAVPKKHALLLSALMYGLQIFVQQAIGPLIPQVAVATLNDLLQALVLGCYNLHVRFGRQRMTDAVKFLFSIGANPNAMVRPVVSSKTRIQVCTTWELYLDHDLLDRERSLGHENFVGLNETTVLEELIESGADLECKTPAGCKNIQQAIERRLEEDYPTRSDLYDDALRRIRIVLLKRGFTWV